MKRRKKRIVILSLAGILLTGIVGLFIASLTVGRPESLGLHDNRLAETPESPNCVSSQSTDQSHWIAPLNYEGTAETALADLRTIVESLPRSTIVSQTDRYIHVEFRSAVFRFVDDVEFLVEPETQRIHFRSASRLGYSDLGVNRARMERIRSLFRSE